MENNNKDISYKINLLYNFLYNNDDLHTNVSNCYEKGPISLGNINMDDIKFSLPKDENSIDNYNDTIKDVLEGSLKFISYDETQKQIIVKKYFNDYSINIKISFYTDKEINALDKGPNLDSLISYILSSLVIHNKTKHILLPIINIDTKIENIMKIINNSNMNHKIKDDLNEKRILDICCLQCRESFFKTTPLDEFIKQNKCSIKNLLFQLIHTLAVIQNEYSGFKHNNLLLKNIIIYQKKESSIITKYDGFRNDNINFYLPNDGFDIKLSNFEHATIPKHYNDVKTTKDDLKTFVDDLLKDINADKLCDKKTSEFIKKINNYINIYDLLYDDYFIEFTKYKSNTKKKSYNKHEFVLGMNSIKLNESNSSILGKQYKISNYNIIPMTRDKRIIDKGPSRNIRYITEYDDFNDTHLSRKNILQKGGDKVNVAPYKNERNNPSLSNEQRRIMTQRSNENPVREPAVLLEQKIYEPTQKSQTQQQFPPSFIPTYDPNGDISTSMYPNSNKVLNQPPIQKVYNISLSNPLGNYTTINRIYEDILPGSPYNFTALTIFERTQLIDFIRNSLIEYKDGEETTISGGKNSLLSYLKVIEVNPYSTTKNPYEALPRNFLLYRAGYPVRFQNKTKTIGIAKPSMNINVRIYMMSLGDIKCYSINNTINQENFNLWREMKYYDWVKKDLITNKVSPNFIAPILFKIDPESKLDWNKLHMLRYNNSVKQKLDEIINNEKMVNNLHDEQKRNSYLLKLVPFIKMISSRHGKELKTIVDNTLISDKIDITENSGKSLILLTEAPTTSFIQWASAMYEKFGTVKKMISSGYHLPEIWKCMIFQLLYIFAILQEKQVYIENIDIYTNLFVKDIFSDSNAIGSWVYKINDIEFYVPNYGYILQFDSFYNDISTNNGILPADNHDKQRFKIYGNLFKNNSDKENVNMRDKIYEQFKSFINPDNFSHTGKVQGISIPDVSIIQLLTNIHNSNIKNIKDIILEFFYSYVNNRVGTLLMKTEKENINILSKPIFQKGKLMIYQKRYQEFEWVIYIGDSETQLYKKKIICNDNNNNNLVITDVFSNSLYNYPETETILPISKINMKYDDSHIYERYNFDNLVL